MLMTNEKTKQHGNFNLFHIQCDQLGPVNMTGKTKGWPVNPPISPLTGRPNEITYSCERLFQTLIGWNSSGYPFEKNCHPFERLRLSVLKRNVIPWNGPGYPLEKKMSSVAKPACVTLPRLQTKPHGVTHGQFLFRTPAPLLSIRQEIMHCLNRWQVTVW